MKPIPGVDLERDLQTVRETYVKAFPEQRLRIVHQRLQDHHFGPNRLVTAVSAVEAFSRSLLLHWKDDGTRNLIVTLYEQYKDANPEEMIVEYLRLRGLGSPREVFGSREWVLFSYATRFRNLVVHECTYLGLDKFPSMIDSCGAVLEKLVQIAGLNAGGVRDMVNKAGLDGTNLELGRL